MQVKRGQYSPYKGAGPVTVIPHRAFIFVLACENA